MQAAIVTSQNYGTPVNCSLAEIIGLKQQQHNVVRCQP